MCNYVCVCKPSPFLALSLPITTSSTKRNASREPAGAPWLSLQPSHGEQIPGLSNLREGSEEREEEERDRERSEAS